MPHHPVLTRNQLLALVALTIMWGVNWPMMKLSLRELSPLYFRAITMTLGASWLFVFFRLKGIRMWPEGAEWRTVATLALPNMLGWHTISIFGLKELSSGRASILGFTMPIWTVLLGAAFFGQKLNRRVVWATLAVSVAIALLMANELQTLAGRPLGVLWMELAALSWALGTLMMRRAVIKLPTEALVVWMMLLTCGCVWVLAVVFEPVPSFQFSARHVVQLAVWRAHQLRVCTNHLVRAGAQPAASHQRHERNGHPPHRHTQCHVHRGRSAALARLCGRGAGHVGHCSRAAARAQDMNGGLPPGV
jgi:drug/metabolite transporter (DMT)-like permease